MLALHSLSEVLHLLHHKEEEEVAAISDHVAPLPGERRRRWTTRSERVEAEVGKAGRGEAGVGRAGRGELLRNTSIPSGLRLGSAPLPRPHAMEPTTLPRTFSTSVLRIKQRRSFWEKFVQ